jgi:hypothetical protein
MKFSKLQTKVEKLIMNGGLPYRGVISRVDCMLDQARINADDTPNEDWETVAMATLEMLLSYSDDNEVAEWFRANGVKW